MNYNFYIFGNPSGKFTQYPDDYLSSVIEESQLGLTGSRLVIKRELNLFHYIFFERIDESHFIGFCIIFNNSLISKPKCLINLFKNIIEDVIITKGVFLRYNQQGNIYFSLNSFSDNVKEISRIRAFIDNELEKNPEKYGIKPTETIYNGTRTSSSISIDAPDAQIISLTDKYNTVIVDSSEGVESGYLEKVMSDIRTEKERALTRIVELENDVSRLNKQKKQYGWIAFLSIAVLAALLGLYFLNSNLTSVITNKNAEITRLGRIGEQKESKIIELRDSIKLFGRQLTQLNIRIQDTEQSLFNANKSIQSLTDELTSVKKDLQTKDSQISDLKSAKQQAESSLASLKKDIPINITKIELANTDDDGNIETSYGGTIYSSRTMYIKPRLTYNGINSGKSITLNVRFYTPGGLSTGTGSPSGFSYSSSLYVSSGSGKTATLSGWGGKAKGHWKSGSYRIEIWYGDVCLKSKSFTIY